MRRSFVRTVAGAGPWLCVAYADDAQIPCPVNGEIVNRPQRRHQTKVDAGRAWSSSRSSNAVTAAGSTTCSLNHCPDASGHRSNPSTGQVVAIHDRRPPHPLQPPALDGVDVGDGAVILAGASSITPASASATYSSSAARTVRGCARPRPVPVVIRGPQLGQRHLGIGTRSRTRREILRRRPVTGSRGSRHRRATPRHATERLPRCRAVDDRRDSAPRPGDDPRRVERSTVAVCRSASWPPDDDAPRGDAERAGIAS